ncbi:hypothetical protein QFZ66_000509 [Streptomyces sp. B4I13]|uniref:hypothetical protein n=1 Tax=Streptomyces sp. B4I13 TaxID=3042271 RepID=UPI00278979D1|nr:hypothetical protein [Streptomyces sp. B4I13]MDQ0956631.1 hypothetical protein [Streptomyces sp. B4I13]
MASILYRVRECIPDARSALRRARAREIMRDKADLISAPWPQLKPVSTAEQYAYALRSVGTARLVAHRDPVVVIPVLDELERRDAITFDAKQPKSLLEADLRLSPRLGDLWPLPEGVTLTPDSISPFGAPNSEPEDDATGEELDRMVAVLGPLSLNVSWSCNWRGMPYVKNCGLQLGLNRVWTEQTTEVSPGEFVVRITLGTRIAWTPEGEAWRRDSGLLLGEQQQG